MQIVRDLIGRFLPGHETDFLLETIPAEDSLDKGFFLNLLRCEH